MKFTPKSENELAEENLLPAGNYPFEVITAEDKQSKAGNDMIEINMRLYTPEGRAVFQKDWLMEAMGFKLRHFCEETGLISQYDAGTLCAADCDGKQGFLTLKQDKAKGDFGPKNSVKDYGKEEPKEATKATTTAAKDADISTEKDDIPF